jgi:hypothetical protein
MDRLWQMLKRIFAPRSIAVEGPMRYATTFEEETPTEGVATPTLKTVS